MKKLLLALALIPALAFAAVTITHPSGEVNTFASGSTTTFASGSTLNIGSATVTFPSTVILTTGAQSLASKTLTSPIITGGLFDGSTNELLTFSSSGDSVNYLNIEASIAASPLVLTALGSDTDIGINLVPKGAGTVQVNGVAIGAGTVTSVSVITANGVSGTVATDTTTPAITLTLGAITPSSITIGGVAVPTISSTSTLTNKTISLASNTLTATSAQLVTAISDETGTGAAVFAASPSFSGTLTLNSTSNWVCTAAYLGSLNGYPFYAGQGTAATPGIANINNGNTGIYFPTSTTLGISTGGVARAIFTGSGVAIGASGTPIASALSAVKSAFDCPSIAADGGVQTTTLTVTGAVTGNIAVASLPSGGIDAGVIVDAYISAADTVTIRFTNTTAGAIDPASATYRVLVLNF